MKATDVIQPTAMQTPIAVNGSKDNIPQYQSSTSEPWYCSIENGFPDMTMQALNQGGRPPRGQGANGLFYLSTDQKVYLQNGGTITFSEAVSNAIGGYPMGAILDYVYLGVYNKVISLVDDNTVNFLTDGVDNVNWQLLTIGNGGGGGGEIGANVDLTNLTSFGNGKFQCAPFSINAGAIDANGDNETLTTSGGTPLPVDTYIIPELSANTTQYGTCTNYLFTTENVISTASNINWSMNFAADNYIPAGATVSFTLNIGRSAVDVVSGITRYGSNKGCKVTYIYTDDTEEVGYDSAVSGYTTPTNTWILYTFNATNAPTKTVKGVSVVVYIADNYHCMGGKFTLTAQYNVSTSDTLISQPCTITTADSRTKTFTTDNILDCSQEADGTYKVLKSYTDGSLSLNSRLLISKIEPQAITDVPYEQPALTSSSPAVGGDACACEASSYYSSYYPYKAFAAEPGSWMPNGKSGWITFYNPFPIKVTAVQMNTGSSTYPVNSGTIYGSNDNSNFDTLATFSNSTHPNTLTVNVDNNNYYKYYRISVTGSNNPMLGGIHFTATYQEGTVFNDGDLWLDNSKYPLTLKQYDSSESEWVVNNDLVYIGDVTVGSGYITAITNRYFNACPALRILVNSYQNGISNYDIYSDGYCVQRGDCTSGTAVVLLKTYKNSNYALTVPFSAKSASSFTPSQTGNWIAQGYIE